MRIFLINVFAQLLTIGIAFSQVPKVVTDIAPVHSLVSQIMQGVSKPDILFNKADGSHSMRLNPSKAMLLQDTDFLFYVSQSLTPWIEDAAHTLNPSSIKIELINLPNVTALSVRKSIIFDETHQHKKSHPIKNIDPHMWLSPFNMIYWLQEISIQLIQFDPDNAEIYRKNTTQSIENIHRLIYETNKKLASVESISMISYHDSFQYFEHDFKLSILATFSDSDASKPSAKRMIYLHDILSNKHVICIILEPYVSKKKISAALNSIGKTAIKRIKIDIFGNDLELGVNFYSNFINRITNSMLKCKN